LLPYFAVLVQIAHLLRELISLFERPLQHTATATHCNCNTLQLQHTATHCNTLLISLFERPRTRLVGKIGSQNQSMYSFGLPRCVVVCCSVLRSVLHCVAVYCLITAKVCVVVCCSVLQCVAVCCSVLRCVATRQRPIPSQAATHCNTLQHSQ